MTDSISTSTPAVLQEYYRVLAAGFRDDVIDTLNLHFDGRDYIAKGGR